MGASFSKQVISNAIDVGFSTETISKLTANCTQSSNQDNVVEITSSSINNLTVEQQNISEGLCTMKSILENTMENDIDIDKAFELVTKQTKEGLIDIGLQVDSKTIDTSMRMDFEKKDVVEKALNTLNKFDNSNIIRITGSSATDSSIKQLNKSILKSFIVDELKLATSTDLSTTETTSAKSEQSSKFSLVAGGIIILVVLIVLVLVYLKFR